MPALWELARDGDLAGVKAAIEAGANLEETDYVREMNQQCTRPSPPPPSHSVLTTRLLPHAPPHRNLLPPHARRPHSGWLHTASLRLYERARGGGGRAHGSRCQSRGEEQRTWNESTVHTPLTATAFPLRARHPSPPSRASSLNPTPAPCAPPKLRMA